MNMPLDKKLSLKALKLSVYGYYGIGKVLNKAFSESDKTIINRCVFFPEVSNAGTLGDLVNRISWYLPKSIYSRANIYILVNEKLLSTELESLPVPSSQQNYAKRSNIKLIKRDKLNLSMVDAIMLWDKKHMLEPAILRHMHKVRIVDPTYYFSVEAETYQRLYFATLEPSVKEYFDEISKSNYQTLLNNVKKYERAYVFGTGPSLEKFGMDFDYSDGFRIVCNSIIINKKLMNHIKPHLLVFGDAQHHSSPCIYSEIFRKAAIESVHETGCYVLTKDYFLPLFLEHYPEIKDKVIGIEAPGVWDLSLKEILFMLLRRPHKLPWFTKIPGHDEEYNFPNLEKFYLRSLGSVLPSYMIPVASSCCDYIYILGADGRDPGGRKPDETYIWEYSSSCQFDEQTAFDTHPSYFRDRPYTEDFDIYCENFDGLIRYGESLGKKYYSLAPSHIPSLAQRLVSHKTPHQKNIQKI